MPTAASLCSGYGGDLLAVASVIAGVRVAWVAETDPAASLVLAEHWPGIPNHGDIERADWTTVERPDILAAGFPCQPWSAAGARRGAGDARDLWPAVRHAVGVLRPRLVFLENVDRFAGLAAGAGRTVGDLAALGYDTRWCVLGADDVGAPHRRDRWWCAAWPADTARSGDQDQQVGGNPGGLPLGTVA